MTKQRLINRVLRDTSGKVVIFQPPNLPIITWFVCTLLGKITPNNSTVHSLLIAIAFGALFTWAWMEIFSGINYARKAAGVVILVLTITHFSATYIR